MFSPDGTRLAVTLADGLAVWDLSNWSHRTLTNIWSEFNNLAFTPDGDRLVCGGDWRDRRLRFWDLRTGIVNVIGPIEADPVSVTISADGKWLAVGTVDGEVWLWDLAARQFVTRFQAAWGRLYGLAFSPDGTRLATGGNDQLIHVWQTGTSNQLAALRGHLDEIWSLEFSCDGKTLASAGKDGTAKLWSVHTRQYDCLVAPRERANDILTGSLNPAAALQRRVLVTSRLSSTKQIAPRTLVSAQSRSIAHRRGAFL